MFSTCNLFMPSIWKHYVLSNKINEMIGLYVKFSVFVIYYTFGIFTLHVFTCIYFTTSICALFFPSETGVYIVHFHHFPSPRGQTIVFCIILLLLLIKKKCRTCHENLFSFFSADQDFTPDSKSRLKKRIRIRNFE